MTTVIKVAPVRKSIRVKAAPERAFRAFTAEMSRWWIKTHSINTSPIRDIVMEPWPGGRWFERGEDGSECDWGRVLSWEPPARLLLAWQLTPQWQFDPALMTEPELRFIPDGEGTRVEIEHRLDGYGEAAADMFKVFEGPNAWPPLSRPVSPLHGPPRPHLDRAGAEKSSPTSRPRGPSTASGRPSKSARRRLP